MNIAKKVLVAVALCICIGSVEANLAYAATEPTAKSVLKKALKYEQKATDNIVQDYKLSYQENTTINGETTKNHVSIRVQVQDKSNVLRKKESYINKGDQESKTILCSKKDDAKHTYAQFIYQPEQDNYDRYKIELDDQTGSEETSLFEQMYACCKSIKYINKNAKKDGKDAYYIFAQLDLTKFLQTAGYNELTNDLANIYGLSTDTKRTAKVKAYVNKSTGKLMYLKIDLTNAKKNMLKDAANAIKATYSDASNKGTVDFSYEQKSVSATIVIQINPKSFTEVKMPTNYVDR